MMIITYITLSLLGILFALSVWANILLLRRLLFISENLDNLLRFYTWWEEYNKWLKIEDKLLSDRKLKLVVFQLTYAERTPIEWLYQLQYAWIRGALNHLERVDFEDIKKTEILQLFLIQLNFLMVYIHYLKNMI